jgi:hypothetical protein
MAVIKTGDLVCLLTAHQTYVALGQDGQAHVSRELDEAACFRIEDAAAPTDSGRPIHHGMQVALRCRDGTHLCAGEFGVRTLAQLLRGVMPGGESIGEGGPEVAMQALRRMTLVHPDRPDERGPVRIGGEVALRAAHGRYLCALPRGLAADREPGDPWARFVVLGRSGAR